MSPRRNKACVGWADRLTIFENDITGFEFLRLKGLLKRLAVLVVQDVFEKGHVKESEVFFLLARFAKKPDHGGSTRSDEQVDVLQGRQVFIVLLPHRFGTLKFAGNVPLRA